MTSITWVGLTPQQLAHLADAETLIGPPMSRALAKAGLVVESDAKRNAPVDTGRLRASITNRVDTAPLAKYVEIGTNVSYARWVHNGRRPGSMPPARALFTWSRRHGNINPYVLARVIQQRGIRPRPFLTEGLIKNVSRIVGFFRTAGQEIEQAWGSR